MKTIIVTGSYPPEVCGVGDYVYYLTNTREAANWILFYRRNWKIYTLFSHIKTLLALKPGKIFLQYPTQGYGWSIVPHLLCFFFVRLTKIRLLPILHEYSELSLKARFALNIIIFSAKEIVVTNLFEKNVILKKNPKLKDKVYIIKIFSNISTVPLKNDLQCRHYDIAYFGQIRPNKGLEKFIAETVQYRLQNKGIKIAIIGNYPNLFKDYFNKIIKLADSNKIEMFVGKTAEEVSELLNNSKILYLPFPDGCSERRGSYLAGMENGCVIVTIRGKYTTEAMNKTAFFITSDNSINSIFENIICFMDKNKYLNYQTDVNYFLSHEIPISWNEIAKKYNNI